MRSKGFSPCEEIRSPARRLGGWKASSPNYGYHANNCTARDIRSAFAKHGGTLLVPGADSFKQRLGERNNVFAAHAQRGNGEPDGAETESEVGQKQALGGHLTERCLR